MNSKSLLASSLGNILEWFDFGFFIFIAPIIGRQFFPTHDSKSATMAAFGVFAAGFICRPLGGIFFGHLGDRTGRSNTLRFSIFLITLTTIIVGILPSYHTIGIASSVIFTIMRLIQGLSIGGEYTGITIYLAESAHAEKRGFFTSFALMGANLGFLFATLTVLCLKAFFTESALNTWAWRIPFLIIGLIGLFLFYFRLKLAETPVFNHFKTYHKIQKQPLFAAVRFAPGKLLKILGLTCMSATFYYVLFGYMPNYLILQLGIPSTTAFTIQSIMLASTLILVPIGAILGDTFGRKNMLLLVAFSLIILIIPCFYLLTQKTLGSMILALGIATLLSSFDQGNSLTAIVENCPVDVRYSGISLAYNLGNAIFGGTAPIIMNIVTQRIGNIAPAYYLVFMTMISLCSIFTLVRSPHTHFFKLAEEE